MDFKSWNHKPMTMAKLHLAVRDRIKTLNNRVFVHFCTVVWARTYLRLTYCLQCFFVRDCKGLVVLIART